MNTEMKMEYKLITPEIAKQMLEKNTENRRVSAETVNAYVEDMKNGNWDETVGSAISLDSDGIIRDGQHRLIAIVKSGVSIRTWVCTNVSKTGVYDLNRKRSASDIIKLKYRDIDGVYRSSRYIGCARLILSNFSTKKVTPSTVVEWTIKNKDILDGFFTVMPQSTIQCISTASVFTGLYLAYLGGVDINDILSFYKVLSEGMSTTEVEFPIIALRNRLISEKATNFYFQQINAKRTQYALKKYLDGSCTKKCICPDDFIWPYMKKEVQ